MRRRRLSRKVPKKRPYRLSVLKQGFDEGMQGASNKHLHQYLSMPEWFVAKNPIAMTIQESAKKEIARRKMLMKKWGKVYPSVKLSKLDKVELIRSDLEPLVHVWKNALIKGKFADELIKVIEYEQEKLESFFKKVIKRAKKKKKA